jgi:tetratricopeptide (TPR) repeat protein
MTGRINIGICLLLLISIPAAMLQAQILEDQRQHVLLMQGIDYTLKQDYNAAEQSFQSLIKNNPKHPAGYLYLAGMLQARNTDYGDPFNEKRYDSLLNIVEILAKPLLSSPRTAAAGYFYTGSAEAFRSYTKSENGNFASGIYYGLAAGSTLEKCLKADPTFTEAKNILGSFYYWRSKLAWIPFVPDRSQEGIDLINESFSHPYEKHLASHNLMVIFTEEKRYADAERYGLIMLKEYPENRLFLWNLMTVYEQWNKQTELIDITRKLLNSTVTAAVTNRYTEAVCRLKLARHAIASSDPAAARTELEKVIALKPYIAAAKGDLRKKISQAEELLKTLD